MLSIWLLRSLRAYPKTFLGSGHPPLVPPRGGNQGGVAKSEGRATPLPILENKSKSAISTPVNDAPVWTILRAHRDGFPFEINVAVSLARVPAVLYDDNITGYRCIGRPGWSDTSPRFPHGALRYMLPEDSRRETRVRSR
jgi:hypothetical protein